MNEFHLAEINIARLLAPLDDPQIADFVAELGRINALADDSDGFIWRLQGAAGNATGIASSADPFVIVNMSLWTGPEALRQYVYRSGHIEVFRRRAEWFEPHTQSPYCLWWVPSGYVPSIEEGRQRLDHYHRHGPTSHAFWFQHLYPAPVLALA